MKTIKDIITRKKNYTSHVNVCEGYARKGDSQCDNRTTGRNTLSKMWVGGDFEIFIEKFEVEVCGYSMIRQYRIKENGYKPYLHTFYRYTYLQGKKRLTSRDFRSLDKLIKDMKVKTSEDVLKGTSQLSEVL